MTTVHPHGSFRNSCNRTGPGSESIHSKMSLLQQITGTRIGKNPENGKASDEEQMKSNEVKFFKFECLERDYILLDNRDGSLGDIAKDEKLLAKMCRYHRGIGAEGVVEIKKHQTLSFEIKCYGQDGHPVGFSLSAGCCGVSYARECNLLIYNEIYFQADGQTWFAIYDQINHKVHLKLPGTCEILKIDNLNYRVTDFLTSCHVTYISPVDMKNEARTILQSGECENVCFASIDEKGKCHIRVFCNSSGCEVASCSDSAVATVLAEGYRREYEGLNVPDVGEEYSDYGVYHQDVYFETGYATIQYEKKDTTPGKKYEIIFIAQTDFVFQGIFPLN